MSKGLKTDQETWEEHNLQWRDPQEVIAQKQGSCEVDHRLLQFTTQGPWWDLLSKLKIRLLISREYEHLLLSLGVHKTKSSPAISYLSVPHPSGIAVDRRQNKIHVASTRNPNQIYTFGPTQGFLERNDMKRSKRILNDQYDALVPLQTSFYPGSLYIHDIAMIGNDLCANAVAHNAIVKLNSFSEFEYLWWPKSVERNKKLICHTNYLQLNSIAAGKTIKDSYFSASTDAISSRRPGHINFSVDKRGVIFSGKTREPICRHLTRPHSARIYNKRLWVDNSGYGEFGYVDQGSFQCVTKLPGWTRGLSLYNDIAFVGTSRVIPKFYRYAPGLKVQESVCGIHAIDLATGKVLASLQWPHGNQIFAIEWIPSDFSQGFPYEYLPKRNSAHMTSLFYAFKRGETQ